MAQLIEFLPPMWKTQILFLAPNFATGPGPAIVTTDIWEASQWMGSLSVGVSLSASKQREWENILLLEHARVLQQKSVGNGIVCNTRIP